MSEVTILMVEDDAVEAIDIRLSLESLGYKILASVSTGEEAIEYVSKNKPELILMDIMLAGELDGIQTAEIIMKSFNIPIIYLTAYTEKTTLERAKLTGPYAYLLKPFDSSELERVIEFAIFKHEMETKLERNMAHFRNIFENAPIGIFHSSIEGKLYRVNRAFSKIFGYDSSEELIRIVNESTIQDKLYINGDIRQKFVREAINSDEWHSYNNQYYKKDGSIIDTELSFRAVKNDNKVQYLEGFINDISEKIEAEKALKEIESLYNLISENTGDVIWIMDIKSNKFTYVNPSVYYLLGFTPEEVLKQDFHEVMTPESYKHVKEKLPIRIEKFLSGNEACRVMTSEIDQIHRDGSKIPTEVVTTLLMDDEGNLNEILGISRDIRERKEIEENLVESEERNRLLIENSGMGIGYWDTNGELIMFNKFGASQLNGKPEEFVGKSFKEIFDEASADQMMKRLSKAIKTSTSQIYEKHVTLPNNEKWFILTFTRIENAEGEIIGVQIVSNDVTVLKKAQRERDRFFNLSSNMICIIGWDGFFKQLNPAWERILGWSNRELLCKPYYEFIHTMDRTKTPIFTDVIGDEDSNIKFENRFLSKDGSYKWLSWSASLLKDEGIVFADVRDITQQKISEEALKESEEKYRTLFEADPDYTILLDTQGIIVDVNDATTNITGIPRERIVGKTLTNSEINLKEDMNEQRKRLAQIINEKKMQRYETKLIDKNGNMRWVNVKITVIEMDNHVLYVLIIASDITESKQFEKELRDSIREKEVLLQEIHHRVKNNMQIISSLLNIQTRYLDDEESINVLKESQNRVRSMSMIHEKLYRSKNFNKVHFADYIESLVWDLFYSYSIKKGSINPVLDIDDVQLNIETSVPLGLIITELVSNSLKYAFPNNHMGELTVSLKNLGEGYELIIKDDGIGFPDNIDFRNTDSLGLQLVNSLTDQIDGEIELKTDNGTEFRIIFNELIYKERI